MVSTIQETVAIMLVLVGCTFLMTGAIGLLRLPDVYNRMHAMSKPMTLGTGSIYLASFVYFGPGGAGLPSLLGIAFLFLTVPTGVHMISRAAEHMGVPLLGPLEWSNEDDPESKE
ncbi:monovalent cation/H(+) antiporter subunit G [Halalkalicoccus salilacus]|uniref:monovalent cation/H(+) antiporter subunit G n=1 Tax=Halalkalicoccus salilacus TaxID=3117459 RepID=UPI00300F0BC9